MNQDKQVQTKELLVTMLKKAPIVQVTCEKAGISRATFYRWKKDDSDFAEAVDEALSNGVNLINDMAESQLISAIKDKNMTAIIYWLKNRHRDYSPRLQLSGSIDVNHKAELTDEQKELIMKALQLADIGLPEHTIEGEYE